MTALGPNVQKPTTEFIEVSTATETREAAVALARMAVESRLAAGAQIIGPVISAFWHLGEFGTGEEWRLVLRTRFELFDVLRTELMKHHPWQNPEIVATPILAGSMECLEWIRASTRDTGS
ncbi:divalent-cation tolerance protein CutA [Actinoplanes flavus]|uniref:Divalent-cation tolerance protein CutA n=1 Tax=Actinoplanes flavus TaxID=2820290 RepID=A0ABS3UXJ3_9ACTN|nr:divalent-cation tolerance protein CutA [Actinoplanes flavus]MBO3743276.1 divalent-cation tolerance protein CutA [Actinoplanes flavus]